jgi:hypothetical protein
MQRLAAGLDCEINTRRRRRDRSRIHATW